MHDAPYTPRTHRPQGQPALPGHDELRPPDDRDRTASRSWTAPSNSGSTSSTPRTSTDGRRAKGCTEQIVGRWLAQGGGRREKIVLATKVYGAMGDGPNERRLSAYHIRRACEEQPPAAPDRPHRPLPDAPRRSRDARGKRSGRRWSILVRAGEGDLRREQQLRRMAHRAGARRRTARHFLGLVSEQSLYNLTDRTIELEVIPACRALGLGLIPWSPLAGGLLGGVLREAAPGAARIGEPAEEHREAQARGRGLRGALPRRSGRSPPTSRSRGSFAIRS